MTSVKACSPYAAMIVIQLAYAGSTVLTKLALEDGLSYIVFIVYRHIISMFILGFFALLLERKQLSSLTWPILGKIFLLALIGVTIQQNVFYAGLEYASATVATALANVIPALTFLLAIFLRMEKIDMKSAGVRAKCLGTVACIGGALIFTFWKGYLFKGFMKKPIIVVNGHEGSLHVKEDWVRGSVLIIASNASYSMWLVLQAKICEVYKAKLSMNTLMCFFVLVQCSILAVIFERSREAWLLGWNIKLFTIIYSGIMISGLVYYLQSWCIEEKGPVFAAMFYPLLIAIVSIFSAIFLAERLHLGSVVGIILIVSGLYLYLWGKNKAEDKRIGVCDDRA